MSERAKQNRTWVEIDLAALVENARAIRRQLDGAALIAVVKKDAYGHGARECALALEEARESDRFAVYCLEEALELRQAGIKSPILVMSPLVAEDPEPGIAAGLTLTVLRFEEAERIDRLGGALGKKVSVHLKIDTGMGRLGYYPEQALKEFREIQSLQNLNIEGIYSHLATVDEDKEYTCMQLRRLQEFCGDCACQIPIVHLAQSGVLQKKEYALDAARIGLALYGAYEGAAELLQPVMTFKSRVIFRKRIPKGESVSYGCTYTAPKDMEVAVVGAGYGNGYLRAQSNQATIRVGGHPAPDADCARGCERIIEMTQGLTERDLVFTCVGNGVSSLLTMPVPGLTIDDLSRTTYVTQIERGTTTGDLCPIRNHMDMMKGGKISRYIHPARMVHILAIDPGNYSQLMYENRWLHTLPDSTTYQMAVENLKKEDAWDAVPEAVREHFMTADPRYNTVKAEEFEKMAFRIFGIMPGYRQSGMLSPAMKKAEELGFKPVLLTRELGHVEAGQAGMFVAAVAAEIERRGQPFEPPCALFTHGEFVVTVGSEKGMGGRNQEFALSAALRIAGSRNIIIGSVDTDGTDGPGDQFSESPEGVPCLAGGIVDGETVEAAKRAGVNLAEELRRHNTSEALWKLDSGVVATPNISLNDLTVALIMERSE